MKPKPILVRLPEDLEKRGREIAGTRKMNTVILEALRAQWLQIDPFIDANTGHPIPVLSVSDIPIWGSIPAEKRDV